MAKASERRESSPYGNDIRIERHAHQLYFFIRSSSTICSTSSSVGGLSVFLMPINRLSVCFHSSDKLSANVLPSSTRVMESRRSDSQHSQPARIITATTAWRRDRVSRYIGHRATWHGTGRANTTRTGGHLLQPRR